MLEHEVDGSEDKATDIWPGHQRLRLSGLRFSKEPHRCKNVPELRVPGYRTRRRGLHREQTHLVVGVDLLSVARNYEDVCQ